jgi:hypothetical protein
MGLNGRQDSVKTTKKKHSTEPLNQNLKFCKNQTILHSNRTKIQKAEEH